jgi:hypothetical protein
MVLEALADNYSIRFSWIQWSVQKITLEIFLRIRWIQWARWFPESEIWFSTRLGLAAT